MKTKKIILFLILLGFFCFCSSSAADEETEDARKSYNSGIDFFEKLDYNRAVDDFFKALNTENKHVEQWAAYNLGNAKFKNAENAEQSNPQASLSDYTEALEFFKRAIEMDPQDLDAKYNYEVTLRKIKAQQEKAKQDKKEQKNQKDQKQQDQENKQQQKQQQQKDQEQEQKDPRNDQGKKDDQENSMPQEVKNLESRQMSKEEAMMLLENFEQSEKKQKEILFKQQHKDENFSGKDW